MTKRQQYRLEIQTPVETVERYFEAKNFRGAQQVKRRLLRSYPEWTGYYLELQGLNDKPLVWKRTLSNMLKL